jgi:hypothetical protein
MSESEIENKFKGLFMVAGIMGAGDFRKMDEVSTLERIGPYIQKQSIQDFMEKVFADCQKPENIIIGSKTVPKPRIIQLRTPESRGPSLDFIKHELNLPNPQPVGIGFCERVLKDRDVVAVNPMANDPQTLTYNVRECGPHASIIIGKKEIDGECKFLIRNTHGTHCKYAWPCMKNDQGQATGIWVSEKALINNLLDMTSLSYPKMKCTINLNGNSEVLGVGLVPDKLPSPPLKLATEDKTKFLQVSYDEKLEDAVFLFQSDKMVQPERLFANPGEGEGGNLFSRGVKLPNIGEVEVVCEKY